MNIRIRATCHKLGHICSDYWHISPLNTDIKLGIHILLPFLNSFKIKITFIIPPQVNSLLKQLTQTVIIQVYTFRKKPEFDYLEKINIFFNPPKKNPRQGNWKQTIYCRNIS